MYRDLLLCTMCRISKSFRVCTFNVKPEPPHRCSKILDHCVIIPYKACYRKFNQVLIMSHTTRERALSLAHSLSCSLSLLLALSLYIEDLPLPAQGEVRCSYTHIYVMLRILNNTSLSRVFLTWFFNLHQQRPRHQNQ